MYLCIIDHYTMYNVYMIFTRTARHMVKPRIPEFRLEFRNSLAVALTSSRAQTISGAPPFRHVYIEDSGLYPVYTFRKVRYLWLALIILAQKRLASLALHRHGISLH